MRGYNERDSLAEPWFRDANARIEVLYTSRCFRHAHQCGYYSRASELASTAATIRGRLLFGVRLLFE